MSSIDKKIIKMYEKDNKSTYEIAEALDTYPNKIRRTLQKHGIEMRTKSSAQQNALKTGRSPHPTEGKKRSHEEKVKISGTLENYWESMQKSERDRRSLQAKKRWDAMPADLKEEMSRKRHQAVKKSAKEGSKLEKFVLSRLTDAGYKVRFHEQIIPSENLEIDLYLPELKTIIEIDGPSHFLPIWGEEKLQKQINADLRKSGTLLSKGFVVIRVKATGSESVNRKEVLLNEIIQNIEKIKDKFPSRSKRFIEVE
tara:strand:+ start:131 stop:895 length:765 start_codon:yes stop_codon:yes gene_type:complete